MRVLFLIGISFFTLTSCVPQLNTINQVAILNGPAEYAVPDLADHFTLRVREANPSAAYQHVSSSRLRFAETHRDLFGSRANPSASLIAKTVGAEFAVLVYAPVYERTVEDYTVNNTPRRKVTTAVQLEVRIVDPVTQETLANYQSARFVSIRRESSETALSEKQDDPDLVQAIENGVNALGPFLSDDLDRLFSKITPPVN